MLPTTEVVSFAENGVVRCGCVGDGPQVLHPFSTVTLMLTSVVTRWQLLALTINFETYVDSHNNFRYNT